MDLFFLQCGLAVAYITHVLLYTNTYSGPIVKKDKFVYNSKTSKSRPVNFFDIVRLILFSPYKIEQDWELWIEDENRLELWSCPVCLSFWISSFVSIPYFFMNGASLQSFFIAATLHFSTALISMLINVYLERDVEYGLQLQEEKTSTSGNTEPK